MEAIFEITIKNLGIKFKYEYKYYIYYFSKY